VVGALLTLLAPAANADPERAESRPPGNNGTVKVDSLPFDSHPDNQPHVGCLFQIDFYGFDEGSLEATYAFALWPPTGSGEVLADRSVSIGEDEAGGGVDLDASVTVDLGPALEASGATPHAQQGFHVRLDVHAEGSIGADVKHKVFWVRACAEPEPQPTRSPTPSPEPEPTETGSPSQEPEPTGTVSPSPEPSGTDSPTAAPTTISPTDAPATGGSRGESPVSPEVLNSVVTSAATSPASADALALTGAASVIPLAVVAFAMLLAGTGALRLGWRRRGR
jgi:hypothetical protein